MPLKDLDMFYSPGNPNPTYSSTTGHEKEITGNISSPSLLRTLSINAGFKTTPTNTQDWAFPLFDDAQLNNAFDQDNIIISGWANDAPTKEQEQILPSFNALPLSPHLDSTPFYFEEPVQWNPLNQDLLMPQFGIYKVDDLSQNNSVPPNYHMLISPCLADVNVNNNACEPENFLPISTSLLTGEHALTHPLSYVPRSPQSFQESQASCILFPDLTEIFSYDYQASFTQKADSPSTLPWLIARLIRTVSNLMILPYQHRLMFNKSSASDNLNDLAEEETLVLPESLSKVMLGTIRHLTSVILKNEDSSSVSKTFFELPSSVLIETFGPLIYAIKQVHSPSSGFVSNPMDALQNKGGASGLSMSLASTLQFMLITVPSRSVGVPTNISGDDPELLQFLAKQPSRSSKRSSAVITAFGISWTPRATDSAAATAERFKLESKRSSNSHQTDMNTKEDAELSAPERALLKRLRNRVSASRCRLKKKIWGKVMEASLNELHEIFFMACQAREELEQEKKYLLSKLNLGQIKDV